VKREQEKWGFGVCLKASAIPLGRYQEVEVMEIMSRMPFVGALVLVEDIHGRHLAGEVTHSNDLFFTIEAERGCCSFPKGSTRRIWFRGVSR
jgi:hypothetical protein